MKNALMMLALLAITAIAGCRSEDERLAQFAQNSAERQAEQNQEMAKLNREVASGTKRLVEADSESRREMVALQQDLQDEQALVGRQRDLLEAERREMAQQRGRESLLAAAVSGAAKLLVCLLPLAVCCYLLHRLAGSESDSAFSEVLIEEIASQDPRLFDAPPSTAISHQPPDSSAEDG